MLVKEVLSQRINNMSDKSIEDKIVRLLGDDSREIVRAVLKAKELVFYNDLLEAQLDTSRNITEIDNGDFIYDTDNEVVKFSEDKLEIINKIIYKGYDPFSEEVVKKFNKIMIDKINLLDIIDN